MTYINAVGSGIGFTLERKPALRPSIEDMTSPAVIISHGPSRIFIVDDDAAVRDSLTLLLRSQAWEAESYGSARAFLDGYRPGPADCLVLDLQMPGMNGLELQEELARRGIAIPVIVITAFANDPLATRARAAGARAVIAKPFRHDTLLRSIREALPGS